MEKRPKGCGFYGDKMPDDDLRPRADEFNPYLNGLRAPVPLWLLRRPISDCSQSTKLIYGVLSFHAGMDGHAFPTIRTIAEEVGLSARQVTRAIDDLRNLNLIRTVPEFEQLKSGKQRLKRNRYFFKIHPWSTGDDWPLINREIDSDPPDTSVTTPPYPPDTGDTTPPDIHDTTPPVTSVVPLREQGTREQTQIKQARSLIGNVAAPSYAQAAGGSDPSQPKVRGDNKEVRPEPTCEENSDTDPPSLEERLARVRAAGDAGSQKAIAQAQANVIRSRENQTKRAARADQARANLKSDGTSGVTPSKKQQLRKIESLWRSEMYDAFPDFVIVKWQAKDRGIVLKMMEVCGSSLVVEDAVRYVVRNWETVISRFKKSTTGYPYIAWVASLIGTLAPEAQLWAKHSKVLEEYRQASSKSDNPFFGVNSDLKTRYRKAKDELKGIGLG